MDARELVTKLHPNALVRELSSGANKVFRVIEGDQSSIVKVYPVSSRERRERHALEALAAVPAVPRIINHGTQGEMAWLKMNDAGHWNLDNLPKNLDAVEAAGAALHEIHASKANITNLAAGIDSDYVLSHYRSTIERLGRYRRRFGMEQVVLEKALQLEPPLATAPAPSHTKPTLSKFIVNEDGAITIVDWEWATLAPPEWDLTLAVWRLAARIGEDAAAAFRSGYGAELPESRYRPWVAYHSAMMMLEAAEVREGRLGDLSYLVDDLTEAVIGT
ncbi:MAG TPA: aminoglycoside phosphotransferase family protein [Acidimicrobiia bacterium]|nr:aminoglycoside phosphotransferase family protein [Acidimicrobiia bacterium]